VTRAPSASRRAARAGLGPPDRVTLFLLVRCLTPLLVLVALAASPEVTVPRGRVVALLLAQVSFGLAAQALAARVPRALGPALWMAMLADLATFGALAAATGGAGSPLVFLFTVEVVAAGILLSSAVGVRLLVLASAALVALDLADAAGGMLSGDGLPRGLQAMAALWAVGGGAIAFSVSNERDLRRTNAELETIRRVTLDIESSLALDEILADLCRGVVELLGFSSAAVLLVEDGRLVCRGAHGAIGGLGSTVAARGPLAEALASGAPVVVPGERARRNGALAALLGPRGYVAVPLGSAGLLVATRTPRRRRGGVVRAREVEVLASLAHHASLAVANARLHAEMSDLAVRDPLTGLANHREFQRVLGEELARLERFSSLRGPGHHVSLAMIDIDRFKRLNDRLGHPAGDAVLAATARAITGAVRSFDRVARYGGEEFAVVLPETDREGALRVAERIRRAVRQAVAVPAAGGLARRLTVSIGVATAPEDGRTPRELVARADEALYRSKALGRDRVTAATAPRRRVVALARPTRRPRGSAARPARAGSPRARARSSRPRRRTPRGRSPTRGTSRGSRRSRRRPSPSPPLPRPQRRRARGRARDRRRRPGTDTCATGASPQPSSPCPPPPVRGRARTTPLRGGRGK
jgi:diguanylate cyclase (GGDEF)-like protein